MDAALASRMYIHPAERTAAPTWHLRLKHATWRDCGNTVAPSIQRSAHVHDVYHVVVVSAGSGSFLGPVGAIAVKAPWLFLVSPGVPHSFQRAPGDDTVYSECTFTGSDRHGAPLRLSWPRMLEERFAQTCNVPAFSACDAALANELEGLIADVVTGGHGAHAAIEGLATGLLQHILFTLFRRLVNESPRDSDALTQARRVLDGRLDDPPSLEELAKTVGLSAKHLGRAFAKRYGMPPGRYRQHAVMQRAASLMRGTDASVADVASQMGFADPRYFIRLFGQVHGVSPGVFRRRRDL